MNHNSWGYPIGKLCPSQGDVHVWRIHLDHVSSSCLYRESMLSGDEIERGNYFHYEKDRNRFITRWVLLRVFLGKYLAADPNRIEFAYNPYGKPSLKQPARTSICFNIAHSEQMALFAFSQGDELGIDIERIKLDIDYENMAEHYFAPGEKAAIRAQESECRPELFFTYWTRKEAYIKGRGMGLSLPLDCFDVSQAVGGAFYPLEFADNIPTRSTWMLLDLPQTLGFTGALAVEHGNQVIRTWDWTESILDM